MLRLLKKDKEMENFFEECQAFCDKGDLILILKGAPTFIFSKDKKPFIILKGNPGMATAGSGDVLTGILASFLAQGLSPLDAAIFGTYLHGFSGDLAEKDLTCFSLLASNIINFLPLAFKSII